MKQLFLIIALCVFSLASAQKRLYNAQKNNDLYYINIFEHPVDSIGNEVVETVSDDKNLVLYPGELIGDFRKVRLKNEQDGWVKLGDIKITENHETFTVLQLREYLPETTRLIQLNNGLEVADSKDLKQNLRTGFSIVKSKYNELFLSFEIESLRESALSSYRNYGCLLLPAMLDYGEPFIVYLDEKGFFTDAVEIEEENNTQIAEMMGQHQFFDNGSVDWTMIESLNNLKEGKHLQTSPALIEGFETSFYTEIGVSWKTLNSLPDSIVPISKKLQILIPVYGDDIITQKIFKKHDVQYFIQCCLAGPQSQEVVLYRNHHKPEISIESSP